MVHRRVEGSWSARLDTIGLVVPRISFDSIGQRPGSIGSSDVERHTPGGQIHGIGIEVGRILGDDEAGEQRGKQDRGEHCGDYCGRRWKNRSFR